MLWRIYLFTVLACGGAVAQNTFFAGSPGDMIYRGSTGWAPVPGGNGGCPMVSNGPTAQPAWTCDLSGSAALLLPSIPTNRVYGNVTGGQAAPVAIDVNQFLNTVGYDILRTPPDGSLIGKDPTTHTWQAITTTTTPNTCLQSLGVTHLPQFLPCPGSGAGPLAARTVTTTGVTIDPADTLVIIKKGSPSATPITLPDVNLGSDNALLYITDFAGNAGDMTLTPFSGQTIMGSATWIVGSGGSTGSGGSITLVRSRANLGWVIP